MGNECPECQTPAIDCKMRDVFKDEPRNRDDLDLSHIKKGEFKMKSRKQPRLQQSAVKIHQIPMSESIVMEKTHKKLQNPKIGDKKSRDKRQQPILIASAVEEIKAAPVLDSQIQTIQLKKGIKYVGGSVHRQPHDRGKISWEDGTTMISQFFLGTLVQNQKVLLQTQNGVSYEGDISGGKANGKGKLILPDGSSYEGEWKDDQPHGLGKQKMSDNSYYEGHFVKGEKTGKGKYYFDDGMYQGLFLNDKFHGEGIAILNDGRTIKGEWKNGLIEGKGEIQWKTGEKYIGTFIAGERDGKGTYCFADGRQWTGQWRNDMQNGFGCYQLPSGVTIKGIWVNGVKTDEMRQS